MAEKTQKPVEGVLEFNFPKGGLNEAIAYKDQQVTTSPLIANCRVRDVSENRARGGQRPGLSKVFSTQAGDDRPVLKMVAVINTYITPTSVGEEEIEGETIIGGDFNSSKIYLDGNPLEFISGAVFSIAGSTGNDGNYYVVEFYYNEGEDRTEITCLDEEDNPLPSETLDGTLTNWYTWGLG